MMLITVCAGVLCTPNVIMIFWQVFVTIKLHCNLLSVLVKILYIAQVTVSNFLPSMALFPLHHVEKPSTTHNQTGARPVSGVDWVSQDLQTVVFDGCNNSAKDHYHIRHTKNSCCDVHIQPNMMHLIPRAKFLDNTHNKNRIFLQHSRSIISL